jgi:hypothetical protein
VKDFAAARPRLCVGVTAHRNLVESEIPGLEESIRALFEGLRSDYPDLPLCLMSPLAEGGDQLAARVALSLDIPLIAVLPMAQAEYEKDFGAGAALDSFRSLLGRAGQIIELPTSRENRLAGDAVRARQLQYAQIGVFISEHSQVLLAIWDGKPGEEVGGTGQVVRYHIGAGMEGIEDDPTPAGLLAEDENDLVCHIVCSRDCSGGEPAIGLEPLQVSWFSSRDRGERTPELPEAYRMMLDRLQRFARDWAEKEHVIRSRSRSLLEGRPDIELPSGVAMTDQMFQAADGMAVHYQQRVHSSLRGIYVLAVLMGLVFLLYSEFNGPGYMVLAFLGLFLGGAAVHIIGESREWHRKYLDYRTLAEGLRVQLYWNLAGVIDVGWAGFAYDNFLQKQDVDVGWIRHVMRQASLHRVRGETPDPAWLAWVIDEWIGSPQGGHGQLAYYSRKHIENSLRFRRTQRLGNLCLWAGILIALALFLQGQDADPDRRNLLMVLMGAFPLIAGIWDAYSHKKAEKELIRQYGFMRRVFERARQLLDEAPSARFKRRVLRALGEAALEEGAEWLLLHRERPLEHSGLSG